MNLEVQKLSLKFVMWFMVLPMYALGIHVGIIAVHIALKYSFIIPLFVRITGILSAVWVLFGLFFYVYMEKVMCESNQKKEQ